MQHQLPQHGKYDVLRLQRRSSLPSFEKGKHLRYHHQLHYRRRLAIPIVAIVILITIIIINNILVIIRLEQSE